MSNKHIFQEVTETETETGHQWPPDDLFNRMDPPGLKLGPALWRNTVPWQVMAKRQGGN
jgi:hypothetical protein